MDISVDRRTRSSRDDAFDVVFLLWSELEAHLERRSKELNSEVRNYPTPIARCDEQLTKLIEQRTRAAYRLKLVAGLGPSRNGAAAVQGLERIRAFLMSPEAAGDDEVELAILSRLKAALAEPRQIDR